MGMPSGKRNQRETCLCRSVYSKLGWMHWQREDGRRNQQETCCATRLETQLDVSPGGKRVGGRRCFAPPTSPTHSQIAIFLSDGPDFVRVFTGPVGPDFFLISVRSGQK